jgi:Rieske Fe-S protein
VLSNRISVDTTRPELANVGDGIQLSADELDYPILFIRVSPDRFLALSTECMHLGCTVKKQLSVIRCPCHRSVYDLEGRVLNGPTEQPLKQYEIRMNGTVAEIVLS